MTPDELETLISEGERLRADVPTEDVARAITAIGGPWSEHTPLSIAQALAERFHITERTDR